MLLSTAWSLVPWFFFALTLALFPRMLTRIHSGESHWSVSLIWAGVAFRSLSLVAQHTPAGDALTDLCFVMFAIGMVLYRPPLQPVLGASADIPDRIVPGLARSLLIGAFLGLGFAVLVLVPGRPVSFTYHSWIGAIAAVVMVGATIRLALLKARSELRT